jgi:hypothetical protein
LTFALLGAGFEVIASEKHELFPAFFGLLWLALGTKLVLNAFKRSPKPSKTKEL